VRRCAAIVPSKRFNECSQRERDGAAVVRRGRLEVLLRLGIVGLERHRPAAFGRGFMDAPGDPAHLAQIGTEQRYVRRWRDRAPKLGDRMAASGRVGEAAPNNAPFTNRWYSSATAPFPPRSIGGMLLRGLRTSWHRRKRPNRGMAWPLAALAMVVGINRGAGI
jgi:hypothetical protein